MFVIATSIAIATASIPGALNLATVSAAKCDNGTPCDGWGDSTSDAATNDGKAVGEHSSTADANGDEPGREGLGNFAGGEKGNKDGDSGNKNLSDLGDFVNGELP